MTAPDEPCQGGGDDDAFFRPGPDYVQSLMAIGDARLDDDDLALVLPLDGRFPEPRALEQAEVFYLRDRQRIVVTALDADSARWLLDYLGMLAVDLHRVACADEELTTSSALRAALASLRIPLVAETDPVVWLEATVLVRALRASTG